MAVTVSVDFRRINNVTIKEHYAVPRVEDMTDTLAGANFFPLSLPTMRSKFTPMTGIKPLSLQRKGTGSGNGFPLEFLMQFLSLCSRLPERNDMRRTLGIL